MVVPNSSEKATTRANGDPHRVEMPTVSRLQDTSRIRLPSTWLMPPSRRTRFGTLLLILALCLGWATLQPRRHSTAKNRSSHSNGSLIETATTEKILSILLIVQGPSENLQRWKQIVQLVQGNLPSVALTLLYGAFDSPINDPDCIGDKWCISSYIPNTTWTEGRNNLTKDALCEEERRGKNFAYFVYSDDDADVMPMPLGEMEKSTANSWVRYFELLQTGMAGSKSPVMALINSRWITMKLDNDRAFPIGRLFIKESVGLMPRGFFLTDTYDAILNAFDRQRIPYLMPYSTLADKDSWWLSQVIHFQIMKACFPISAVIPLELVYKNDAHKRYPRGKNLSMATLAMHEDYGSYLPGIPDVAQHNVRHFDSRLGPFLSISDMKRTVAFQQELTDTEHKCAGLIRRFEDWRASENYGSCFLKRKSRL